MPERGVAQGIISRFGSIDPSEGGRTDRTNASVVLTTALPHDAVLRQQVYYSNYHFNLFSNFTFFLHDSINGDEIAQTETGRNIYGYTGTYDRDDQLGAAPCTPPSAWAPASTTADLRLRHAVQRRILDTISRGRLYEQNINAYLDETLSLTDRLTAECRRAGRCVRVSVSGRAPADGSTGFSPLTGRATRARVSPKLNLYYQLSPAVQLFARSGFGFHSNDARGVVRGTVGANVLPRALGYEVGSTFKPLPSLVVNAALWSLHLQDELVYVGDEGMMESAGPTQRYGVDLSVRYQLSRRLFLDADLNYNHGRQLDAPAEARTTFRWRPPSPASAASPTKPPRA